MSRTMFCWQFKPVTSIHYMLLKMYKTNSEFKMPSVTLYMINYWGDISPVSTLSI